MRIFVTGFGPFGKISDNPSSWVASRMGLPFEILEVSYAAADRMIDALSEDPPEVWLQMGVAAGSEAFRQEVFAHNRCGTTPDVRGEVREGTIDPGLPQRLGATLWGPRVPVPGVRLSFDAGDYLCNYLFFRALAGLRATRVGFLHLPTADIVPLETQLKRADRLAKRLLRA